VSARGFGRQRFAKQRLGDILEVERQSRVVLLDHDSRSSLDGFGTDSTLEGRRKGGGQGQHGSSLPTVLLLLCILESLHAEPQATPTLQPNRACHPDSRYLCSCPSMSLVPLHLPPSLCFSAAQLILLGPLHLLLRMGKLYSPCLLIEDCSERYEEARGQKGAGSLARKTASRRFETGARARKPSTSRWSVSIFSCCTHWRFRDSSCITKSRSSTM
jgi:hypothetical protein